MTRAGEDWRPEFEQAVGEEFSEAVSPPVPFEDASPHECCEVVWAAFGRDVNPSRLAAVSPAEEKALARRFGTYFECDPPAVEQVRLAIAQTLARWFVGSVAGGLGLSP
jgi:hypothetical protein